MGLWLGDGSNFERRVEIVVKFYGLSQRKMLRVVVASCLVGAFVVSSTRSAQASSRDFPFTYDWKQSAKGEKEIEIKTTYSDGELETEIELEYGVSKRFMIAPYLVFGRERGEKFEYKAFQLEARYQLGNYKPNRVLTGLYAEYAKPKDGPASLETRLVLSRYGKNGDDFSCNLVLERAFQGGETEKTLSLGYVRPVGKSETKIGGEFIHNFNENQLKGGPVIAFAASKDIWMTAGYAFALNKRAENKDEIRLTAEYEWF